MEVSSRDRLVQTASRLGAVLEEIGLARESDACSLRDLKGEILRIQKEQDRSRGMMDLTRIKPFLEATDQLHVYLEAILPREEAASLLAHVWGPTRCILRISSRSVSTFDRILEAYLEMGLAFPSLRDEASLRQVHDVILPDVYENVAMFHQTVLLLVSRKSWSKLFKSTWIDFELFRFRDDILKSMALARDVLQSCDKLIKPSSSGGTSPATSDPRSQATSEELDRYRRSKSEHQRRFQESEEKRRKSLHAAVTSWIGAPERSVEDHNHHRGTWSKYPGAAEWIVKNEKVGNWMMEVESEGDALPSHSALWINGKPGSGKSTLASYIIEKCKQQANLTTCYFYCRKGNDAGANSSLCVFKGILGQLAKSSTDLLPLLHDRMTNIGHTELDSEEQAKLILELVFDMTPRAYVIIDGIDQCPSSATKSITHFFMELVKKCDGYSPGKLRVLFVSSYSHDIKKHLGLASMASIREDDVEGDIGLFVRAELASIAEAVKLSESRRSVLEAMICARANGNFFFASGSVEFLKFKTARALAKLADTKDFPRAWDELWAETLEEHKRRLDAQDKSLWPAAQLLFALLMFAQRPLLWHELRAAMSFEEPHHHVSLPDASLAGILRNLGGPFIRVYSGGYAELAHHALTGPLTASSHLAESALHVRLAILCLRYLSSDLFRRNMSDNQRQEHAKRGSYAFQDYAFASWPGHIESIIKCRGSFMLDLHLIRDFEAALKTFASVYEKDLSEASTQPTTLEDSKPFAHFAFYSNFLRLWAHVSASRALAGTDGPLLPSLEASLLANRAALETLLSFDPSQSSDPNSPLRILYGPAPFKCSHPSCTRFYTGFASPTSREHHHARHERPYVCPVESCEHGPFGFQSLKDRDRHVRQYHPDRSEQPPPFVQPTRRVESAKFPCSICGKGFTRKINMLGHVRSHFGERPYSCAVCQKSFTRSNDCKRHEKIHARASS